MTSARIKTRLFAAAAAVGVAASIFLAAPAQAATCGTGHGCTWRNSNEGGGKYSPAECWQDESWYPNISFDDGYNLNDAISSFRNNSTFSGGCVMEFREHGNYGGAYFDVYPGAAGNMSAYGWNDVASSHSWW